jgi:hypothetical protein
MSVKYGGHQMVLCPMCGRPVQLRQGLMVDHRGFIFNQIGTKLNLCLASRRHPRLVEQEMTPELRKYYRDERLAYLREHPEHSLLPEREL